MLAISNYDSHPLNYYIESDRRYNTSFAGLFQAFKFKEPTAVIKAKNHPPRNLTTSNVNRSSLSCELIISCFVCGIRTGLWPVRNLRE